MTIPWGWLIFIAAGSATLTLSFVIFGHRHPTERIPLLRRNSFEPLPEAIPMVLGFYGVIWGALSLGSEADAPWMGATAAAVAFFPGALSVYFVNKRSDRRLAEESDQDRSSSAD